MRTSAASSSPASSKFRSPLPRVTTPRCALVSWSKARRSRFLGSRGSLRNPGAPERAHVDPPPGQSSSYTLAVASLDTYGNATAVLRASSFEGRQWEGDAAMLPLIIMHGSLHRGRLLLAATTLGLALAGCASQHDETLRLSEELGRARADAAWQQAHAAALEARMSRLEQSAALASSTRHPEDRELLN